MTITRKIIGHTNSTYTYDDLNHFDFQGNSNNQAKYEKAKETLNKILEKTIINGKDFTIQIFATLEASASFLDMNCVSGFVDDLSTFKYQDQPINIIAEEFKAPELLYNTLSDKNYDSLREKIKEAIKKLIENSKEKAEVYAEVYFEYNDKKEEEIPNQQPVVVGKHPANDNEVDELEKTYIKRDDDLHQVKVYYKKGIKEQTRHIVFGKKESSQTNEETAKKMVDLYRKDNDEEKRLIAKSQDKTPAILDSVDYQKDAVTRKITGANVCYSQATTNAITKILADNANITKDEFIKATTKFRTAIYILIPGTDKYAKYQLVPKDNVPVFEMEGKSFTREGAGGKCKFTDSKAKITEEEKKKVPTVDSFTIYRTNDEQQQQALWNNPQQLINPIKITVKTNQMQQ